MKNLKIVNKRPILLFAVAMCLGLVTIIYNNLFALKIALGSVSCFLFILSLILFFSLKFKTCKYVFSRIAIVCFAVMVSLAAVHFDEKMYARDYSDYEGYATVSARIAEVGEERDGNLKTLILDNVNIKTDDFETNLKYKASIVVLLDGNNPEILAVGNKITTYAKISFAKLYYVGEYGLTFYYRNKDISVSGYTLEENIVASGNNLTLSDKFKNKIEQIVNDNLDSEYAGLATGMLFGDRSNIDEDIYKDFNSTGIAHILAVSGLHVGFLVTLLMLLLKIFKTKNWIKFIIISAILCFYAYLCGFTVSVVRASIMAICLLLSLCFKEKYDSLNSLSIAFILLVVARPFSITTLGFKLSFAAVLAIILLARPISDLFSKFLFRKMANTIGTMLAVQIGITSVIITNFSHITLTAVVANFISIPIASLAYMILVVSIIIALICPPIAINVYLFQFVMQAVVKFNHLIAPYGLMEIAAWKGNAMTAVSVPAMFETSYFVFAPKKVKISLSIFMWLAFIVILLC